MSRHINLETLSVSLINLETNFLAYSFRGSKCFVLFNCETLTVLAYSFSASKCSSLLI